MRIIEAVIRGAAAALVLWLLLLPAVAGAAPRLEVVGRFNSPLYAVSPPGDARLFVVEQGGTVRIVRRNGTVRSKPFLDLSRSISAGGERGLLSIAFPPDYAASGLVYVYVTARDGDIEVREYRRSARDPNAARPSSRRLVITQSHKRAPNHNGGQLQFDAAGRLWIGMGDGGGANDSTSSPPGNGQRLSTLLGKLLRIDPRGTTTRAYTVPTDNPFVGRDGARPEIWALGLRNPFRFSFDRRTGDLWIGDVGQGAREEVNFAAAADGLGRGANYGWVCFEGRIPTPGIAACEVAGRVAPLLDRDHERTGVCSITGGVVVRDPGLETLQGRYLHGDLCVPAIRAVKPGDGRSDRATGLSVEQLVSFGQDACGRVYTVSIQGPVSRIRDGRRTPCGLPEAPPGRRQG